MEKGNNRQQIDDSGQRFYFNEEGKLIVESNKGVWVDGENYVKMYGHFSCNAKTMGIIIERFKGFPVVVTETKKTIDWFEHHREYTSSAIVNPNEDEKGLIRRNEVLLTRNNNLGQQVNDLKEELEARKKDAARFYNAIEKFNKQPWWKRMFKKVKV